LNAERKNYMEMKDALTVTEAAIKAATSFRSHAYDLAGLSRPSEHSKPAVPVQ